LEALLLPVDRCRTAGVLAAGAQVVGFFMDENKKYKMGEEFNEANLEKFCQGVVDGTAPVGAPQGAAALQF